jgi:hypothetical protein
MFIVSLPFAVLRGGYWAIAAMVGIAYICCYTGKILVECLYEFDVQTGRQIRVRDSYVSIAKECFGKKYGARMVNIAQIIELLMTCILYVVVCGDLMIGTFPEGAIDTRSWMMLVGIFLIPLGKKKNFYSKLAKSPNNQNAPFKIYFFSVSEVAEKRESLILLVHHVPHLHQRYHHRLLPLVHRRLGLGQGQVVPRLGELPHKSRSDRILVHFSNLLAHSGGQHGGPFQVPVDAGLVTRVGGGLQGTLRLHLLPHVPERHPTSHHQQPPISGFQRFGQLMSGNQGSTQLPSSVLRRLRALGESLLQRQTQNTVSYDLGRRRRTESLGAGVQNRCDHFHHPDGLFHPTLRDLDGVHRELHRNHVELHLAVLFPLEAEKRGDGQQDCYVRLFYYISGCAVYHYWNH